MFNAYFRAPRPVNEAILDYKPGSPEREALLAELHRQYNRVLDIPLVIGGSEIRTNKKGVNVCPHEHGHILAEYSKAGVSEIKAAIEAALSAREKWQAVPWWDRAAIFLKAADLASTRYRQVLNAATMLNQSKNPFQAEVDAACETADFFRFNVHFMQEIFAKQPEEHSPGNWNRVDYRPLEGFVFAVSPFNFTSLAGNLAAAPALMGNTVVWKPATSAVYSSYIMFRLFQEAGLPDGVINFVPGSGSEMAEMVLDSEHLGGIHFTGSNEAFNGLWRGVASRIAKYRSYPRLTGETGGKGFVFLHKSADPDQAAVALTRGAFEFQGQKCSAASRAYIPASLWPVIKEKMGGVVQEMIRDMGDPGEFRFFNAVINEASFDQTVGYLKQVKDSPDAEIVFGGGYDKRQGYFIEPTVIVTKDPHFITMERELFAPVLTVYIYEDSAFRETLELCDNTSPFGLTGAIFARDREAVSEASYVLRHAAGNFYINDKPTGAVVGQQPFGGSRASGTNDKAGFYLNLLRWVNPRTIKENFLPATDYRYPFMD